MNAEDDPAQEEGTRADDLDNEVATLREQVKLQRQRIEELEEEVEAKNRLLSMWQSFGATGERDPSLPQLPAASEERVASDSERSLATVEPKRDSLSREISQKLLTDFKDFERLRKRRQRLQASVVGVGVGVLGGAAGTILPAIAAGTLLGGAEGMRMVRNSQRQSGHRLHLQNGTSARPTLKRLKFLVKWGFLQLHSYEDSPPEFSFAVLDEVVCSFSPWVQHLMVLRSAAGCGKKSKGVKAKDEINEHLAVLYGFLVARTVKEYLLDSAADVVAACEAGDADGFHVVRCTTVFPTVLQTIAMFDMLAPKVRVQLTRDPRDKKYQRLDRVARGLRACVEAPIVCDALSRVSEKEHNVSACSDEGRIWSPDSPRSLCIEVPPDGAEQEDADWLEDENEYWSCSDSDGSPKTSPLRPSGVLVAQPPAAGRAANFATRCHAFPYSSETKAHSYTTGQESKFNLRSETYLADQKKTPAGPTTLELVNIDVVLVSPCGPTWRSGMAPDFCVQNLRKAGDQRFFVVQNWVIPPYQAIITGAVPSSASSETPQSKVLSRFLAAETADHRDLFKLVMSVEEGPWLVRRAVPATPAIIGRRVTMNTFYVPGDHLEIVIDPTSTKAEHLATSVVMRSVSGLVVNMGSLIESRQEDELPESFLTCVMVRNLNPSRLFFADVR